MAEKNRKKRNTALAAVPDTGKGGRPVRWLLYVARRIKNAGINLLLFALALTATYISVDHHEYKNFAVYASQLKEGEDSNQYCAFKDGVIRYNKDGVSYMTGGTHEQWIQATQMKAPAISIRGNAFAVYDVGGNAILVFESAGKKGEIKTPMPIEKLSVSGQGIVAVLLKDQSDPVLMVYDAVGNVLARQQINGLTQGYPTALALSADGRILAVSYANVTGGRLFSDTRVYSFSDHATQTKAAQSEPQMKFSSDGLTGDINIFSNGNIAVVGTDGYDLFRQGELEKEPRHIAFDTSIVSLCYDDDKIGVLTRDASSGNSMVTLYDTNGKEIFSRQFAGDYERLELIKDQLILKGETQAVILSEQGLVKYEGDLKDSIITIVPQRRLNHYGWYNKKGYRGIRLR